LKLCASSPSPISDLSLPSLGAWIETSASRLPRGRETGRSLHWERGLKLAIADAISQLSSRSLHWERGLKQRIIVRFVLFDVSLPSLGAWIETHAAQHREEWKHGRSLHWERGLKRFADFPANGFSRRSLHWERGLKRVIQRGELRRTASLPSLGAWIETSRMSARWRPSPSLPSLGAWIETEKLLQRFIAPHVAPFTGSVD